MKRLFVKSFVAALFFLLSSVSYAANYLLFLEAQGITGYSDMEGEGVVYRSAHAEDVMQKNSVGVDYIQKISTAEREIGSFALQAREAYDEDNKRGQFQLYNAYLKGKTGIGDMWGGHNRNAFGLASYLDTHGELFQTMPMYGVGFDRDWGAGYSKDFESADLKLSLTTGTGMPAKSRGNWLASVRSSYGVLSFDNFNLGLSFMGGKIMQTMGYEFLDDELHETYMGAFDAAYKHTRFEHSFEADFGSKDSSDVLALFYRHTINFLDENRLKLNFQFVYNKLGRVYNHYYLAGGNFALTGDITLRAMYEFRDLTDKTMMETMRMKHNKYIIQLYFYKNI